MILTIIKHNYKLYVFELAQIMCISHYGIHVNKH
jgi:hypothetical protein